MRFKMLFITTITNISSTIGQEYSLIFCTMYSIQLSITSRAIHV